MSEEQLYDLARRRITRRNRRMLLLGADIFGFMVYVGVFVAYSDIIPHKLGELIAMIWLGVLVLHTIALSMIQNRDEAVENEVARLRDALHEKSKRLEISDDGELVDDADWEDEDAQRSRNS
jgi:hypothetical protein